MNQLEKNADIKKQEVSDVDKPIDKIDKKLVWVLAVACGLSVANLYYIQPILADMGRSFHILSGQIGFIAILGQIGYAIGLLFIVPLGDSYDRRKLTVVALIAVAVALVGVAVAPTLWWLAIATLLVGITTVVPQIIVPFAASLARPDERGKVVGTVMSGLLIGILLARTVSGVVNTAFGWRAMYWIAAVLMVLLSAALQLLLPKDSKRASISYPKLLSSIWHLARTESVLQEASIYGGLAFGSFNVFWVTLGFYLEGAPYHYDSTVVGLFGLVGVAGALGASFAGRLADRIDSRNITGLALVVALLSFVSFWVLGQWLFGLIIGVILLDLGTQVAHIGNQTRIYALHPEFRNRLNTVYMVSYFVGGSLGSGLGVLGWSIAKWNGVCAVGLLMLALALVVFGVTSRKKARNSQVAIQNS